MHPLLTFPGIGRLIAILKKRKPKSASRGVQKETANLLGRAAGVWVALLPHLCREERVVKAAKRVPGFGWATNPIKIAEPRQWQYFGMTFQWSKWPYISFYVFIFLYVYSHLNDLACFLVMPAKPDLFYLALPSNFLVCWLLPGKLAGRGASGLSWAVAAFFCYSHQGTDRRFCVYFHIRDKKSKDD